MGCRLCEVSTLAISASSFALSEGGSSTPGKRSPMMPVKSGMSWDVNFGRFTSVKDRSPITSSEYLSPMDVLPIPPATSSALSPRMPKS